MSAEEKTTQEKDPAQKEFERIKGRTDYFPIFIMLLILCIVVLCSVPYLASA